MIKHTGRKNFVAWPALAWLMFSNAAGASDGEEWRYSIAPTVWATGIDGTARGKLAGVDVSVDLGEILDFTQVAGQVRFEAIRKWGYFGDIWSARLSDEEDTALGPIEGSFDQLIAEAGALYAFRPDVTGYFGIRYQDLSGEIDFPIIGEVHADGSWVDAIIGVRFTPSLGGGWQGLLRADVGAGNSKLTWLAQVGVGYQFHANWTVRVAYRYLDTHLDDSFEWDMVQEGYGLGLVYEF